ncbi:MAG TPA: tetratricopeptide repeat protein [Chthoniobacterales bacterium]
MNKKVQFSPWVLFTAIAVITFSLYLPTRTYSWVNFDDNDYVTDSAYVSTGLKLRNVQWAFTHFHAGYWIPITWISHMIDCQVWGINPGPPHLVNAALHALNAALLFLVLYSMTGSLWPSGLVAALFAWHPLHVESVAWLAGRKDLISTLFCVLATGAYVRYTRRSQRQWYVLAGLLFVIGLMAKPVLVTWPIILLLLDFWPLHRLKATNAVSTDSVKEDQLNPEGLTVWKAVLEKVPFFVISVVLSIVTIITQRDQGALSTLQQLPLHFRFQNALVSYARYLFHAVWPEHLIALYPLSHDLSGLTVITASLILFGITILALAGLKNRPYIGTGWAWFLITLVPTIGILQSGGQAMADRFTYIPLIGVFIVTAWGLRDLAGNIRWRRIVISTASAFILVACAVSSRAQMKQWKDPIALFSRVLAVAGPVNIAYDHLGAALYEQGRITEAVENFRAALRLNPQYPDAHNNLGAALFQLGQREQAFEQIREALRLDPNYARAYNNYGNALQETGRFEEAVNQYEQALRLKPDYWVAHNNLGVTLLKVGRKHDAVYHFREALHLRPDYAVARRNLTRAESSND